MRSFKNWEKNVSSTGFWDQFESVKDKKSAPAVEGGERQAEKLGKMQKARNRQENP